MNGSFKQFIVEQSAELNEKRISFKLANGTSDTSNPPAL